MIDAADQDLYFSPVPTAVGVGRISLEKLSLASDCCLSTTIAGICDLNTDTAESALDDSPSCAVCAVPLSCVIAHPDFMAPVHGQYGDKAHGQTKM